MKSVLFGLAAVLLVSCPALARERCRGGRCGVVSTAAKVVSYPVSKIHSMPVLGKSSYTVEHPSVVRPACKDGKCSLKK